MRRWGRWGAAALAASVWACADEPMPLMRVERVHFSLVAREDLRTAVRVSPGHTVRATTLAPSPQPRLDGTALPALELVPPCEVHVSLPPLPPGAVLRYAVGADAAAYADEGGAEVTWRIDVDGRNVLDHTAPVHAGVGILDRAWERGDVPLAGARELVLSTAVTGDPAGALRVGFALLEVVTFGEVPRARATEHSPNVVILVVDTLRADRIGAYGGGELTPAIDALAARGTLFERALTASSWTWPSTASILTSLSPPEHGVAGEKSCFLAQELLSVAEVFQREGWTTAAFTVNPLIRSDKDFDQGFEYFAEYFWADAHEVVNDVGKWLDANGEWRFLLYLHLGDPHEYKPEARFAGPTKRLKPKDHDPVEWARMVLARKRGEPFDERAFEHYARYRVAQYDATVRQVDDALGRLFQELKDRGLEDTTVVAFTSDHGEEFLEHGMMGHALQLYRESLAVPLVLAGPGVPRGARERRLVENRLLAPTLMALAGIDETGNLRGGSLLDDDHLRRRADEPVFATTEKGLWKDADAAALVEVGVLHAVRHGDLFLVWAPTAPDGESRFALFDLDDDPGAQRDIGEARPEDILRLRREIERWLVEGARIRPAVLGGGDAAVELLKALGYSGGGDEDG